jgi:hypothetical protein
LSAEKTHKVITMSMNLMAKAMSIKVGNPLRKLVLIKLADNANDNGECWPSYQHIADHCECSKSAVKDHIAALIKLGFMRKENRIGVNNGKGNTSNVYYLNLSATPVPSESTPPVPQKSIGGSPKSTPVPSESTPPVPPAGTRISHSFEPVIEPIGDKKKSTVMPEGFKPSESHQQMAGKLGVSLQEEFEKFTDHHLSKNSKFVDWNRALNTWLRNAKGFQRGFSSASGAAKTNVKVSKGGYVFL